MTLTCYEVMLAALVVWTAPVETCQGDCALSDAGTAYLKCQEEYRAWPYDDATGKRITDWSKLRGKATVGYGHVILPHEREALKGPVYGEQARELLAQDLSTHLRMVNRSVKPRLWPLQRDALYIFGFNTGAPPGAKVFRLVNTLLHDRVPAAMGEWVWVTDRKSGLKSKSVGLKARRDDEGKIYKRAKP
jgi:GH24 family phage-related lysozyme (muramidase)